MRRLSAISLSVRSGDDGWPHDNVSPLIAIVSRDEATASGLARYFSHTRAGVRLVPGGATGATVFAHPLWYTALCRLQPLAPLAQKVGPPPFSPFRHRMRG